MVSGSKTNVCMFVCLSDIQTTCLSCCHGLYYSAIENNYMPFKFCIWIKFLDFTELGKYSTKWNLSSHQCAQPTEQTLLDLCQYLLYWLDSICKVHFCKIGPDNNIISYKLLKGLYQIQTSAILPEILSVQLCLIL